MELTSAQVAAKLGISQARVRALIKNGQLTNICPDPAPNKHVKLDSRQVAEFAKTFNPKYVRRTRRPASAATVPAAPAGSGGALFSRLTAIEAKLDLLLSLLG